MGLLLFLGFLCVLLVIGFVFTQSMEGSIKFMIISLVVLGALAFIGVVYFLITHL
jgi:hypothetical protein